MDIQHCTGHSVFSEQWTRSQRLVICYVILRPHYHIIKAKTKSATASGIHKLSSPWLVQGSPCLVRESTSPRVGNPRVCVSASCPVTQFCTPISHSAFHFSPSSHHNVRMYNTIQYNTNSFSTHGRMQIGGTAWNWTYTIYTSHHITLRRQMQASTASVSEK